MIFNKVQHFKSEVQIANNPNNEANINFEPCACIFLT